MQLHEFTHSFARLLPCIVIGNNLMTNAVWPQSAANGLAFRGAVAGLFTLHFVTKGTGSVWLGAIVNTLIITVTSVAGCTTIVNF